MFQKLVLTEILLHYGLAGHFYLAISPFSNAYTVIKDIQFSVLPSPQALRISHRGARKPRVTGDEVPWTMGKRRGEALARFLLPAFLCA